MNLFCQHKESKKEVTLIQLPSRISYLVYSQGQGGNPGILYRYEQYLYSTIEGKLFKSDYELKEARKNVDDHLKEVKKALRKLEEFKFGVS